MAYGRKVKLINWQPIINVHLKVLTSDEGELRAFGNVLDLLKEENYSRAT